MAALSGMLNGIYLIICLKILKGCKVSVGGQTYDLSSLQSAGYDGEVQVNPPPDEVGIYEYYASFCGNNVTCNEKRGNFVRLTTVLGRCLGEYGTWNSGKFTKTGDGFQGSFEGNDPCSDDFSSKYKSIFNFVCDDSIGNLGTLQATKVGSNTCEYSVEVPTQLACGGSDKETIGGLSNGSIFLIALASFLFLYIVAGIGINYQKDRSFKPLHMGFWCKTFPYWLKMGCLTSWIFMLRCTTGTYRKCCIKICGADGDEKMATGLIDGNSDS